MSKEFIEHTDEDGKKWVVDEDGNKYIPEKTDIYTPSSSGWGEYDTSQGHCALCGRLACGGSCFK